MKTLEAVFEDFKKDETKGIKQSLLDFIENNYNKLTEAFAYEIHIVESKQEVIVDKKGTVCTVSHSNVHPDWYTLLTIGSPTNCCDCDMCNDWADNQDKYKDKWDFILDCDWVTQGVSYTTDALIKSIEEIDEDFFDE